MHHSTGMNRNVWGVRLILRPCLEHCFLCVRSRWRFDHNDAACRSYRPVHQFIKRITERLQFRVHLATAYVGLKECAVTKEFCTVFLLLMRATCSTIFTSECKLKISNMPTQNASYTCKIIKIHSSPKILKANQMSVTFHTLQRYILQMYFKFDISVFIK